MRRNCRAIRNLLLTFFTAISIVPINLFTKEKNSSLPPQYGKWLEEVTYIITAKEKEIFLQLETNKEKDLFIRAFWKQRDPNPLTEKNEFKEEHYKRIDYANRNFGRGTPVPGWKTDRGRIYIILGPPNSIQTYEDSPSIYPTIVWFYQGMSKLGLPDVFNIIFFKISGVGDYKLYSPIIDGPQGLLAHASINQTTYRTAYREILRFAPALAPITLSLIPGEPLSLENPSMASDRLLFDINSKPQKSVKDEYAEKLLIYKDIIELEYTSNYLTNDSLVTVIQDKSGIFFVNYLLEIDRFAMDFHEGKYFTKISVNGKASDSEGNSVFQYEKSFPFEFNEEQFNTIKSKRFSFQDIFPLVEGNYHFNLLLKNEASKEFTSFEKTILIPPLSSLLMSDLILAYKVDKGLPSDSKRAFKVENFQLYLSPRNDFTTQDDLYLFFQILELDEDLKQKGSFLQIALYKDEEKFRTQQKRLSEYDSLDYFLESFSLDDFPPANYRIRVSLFDESQKEILFRECYFYISIRANLERSWISAPIFPPSSDPIYYNILGNQLFNMKKFDRAEVLLEKVYHRNPISLPLAVSYGHVLLAQRKYEEIIRILTPFLRNENNEVLELIARSYHALGKFNEAISYYSEYILKFGASYSVLTLLGDCYYRTGNKEEAIKAWDKSLEINPNQEKIKKLVDSIKKVKS